MSAPLAAGGADRGRRPVGWRRRAAHTRSTGEEPQELFLVFGGRADQPWLRLLRRGFRHCFAAIRDPRGWTVLDPLSGRLLVQRLELDPRFDLAAFYRRAGLAVRGPFPPGPPAGSPLPQLAPYSCVALCRALLGAGAPFALTPYGLFRALGREHPGGGEPVAAARLDPSATPSEQS